MGQIRYSMTVSLDGYISGPDGSIDWSAPDEGLHRFHNEQVSQLGAHLLGRRLYETMLYWEENDEFATDYAQEFAGIWRALPKVVFSNTLTSVEGNARLATSEIADEVNRLRDEVEGDLAVGGARLAGELTKLGLIDEYWLFVSPVVLGDGIPFFVGKTGPVDLELIQTRSFGDRVVHLRYRRM